MVTDEGIRANVLMVTDEGIRANVMISFLSHPLPIYPRSIILFGGETDRNQVKSPHIGKFLKSPVS